LQDDCRKGAFRIREDPRHGGESAKGPGEERAKIKGLTILLQPRKELR